MRIIPNENARGMTKKSSPTIVIPGRLHLVNGDLENEWWAVPGFSGPGLCSANQPREPRERSLPHGRQEHKLRQKASKAIYSLFDLSPLRWSHVFQQGAMIFHRQSGEQRPCAAVQGLPGADQ